MSRRIGRPPLSVEQETRILTVKLTQSLDERLRARAAADESSLSQITRDALEEHLR